MAIDLNTTPAFVSWELPENGMEAEAVAALLDEISGMGVLVLAWRLWTVQIWQLQGWPACRG